jgi:LytS/YehU family sensor histidine kinase
MLYSAVLLILFALVFWGRPFEQLIDLHKHWQMQPPPHTPDGYMPEPYIYNDKGERPNGPPPTGRPGMQGAPPNRPGNGPQPMRLIDIVSIFLYVMTIALGMAIQVTRQWRISRQQVVKAEADKVQAELSFLKAQINPHFLFNTLNNIYTLAITKNDRTADSIMRLSNIMRYVTDEVNHHFVSLEQEVNCINDFIALQRLRLNKKTQIEFSVEGKPEQKKIAPLLLMTFVENIFKYGISNHEPSVSTIQIIAGEDDIRFYCKNKIFNPATQVNRTGIGIANTKKRLEHLYPHQHLLNISNDNGFFSVELMLKA